MNLSVRPGCESRTRGNDRHDRVHPLGRVEPPEAQDIVITLVPWQAGSRIEHRRVDHTRSDTHFAECACSPLRVGQRQVSRGDFLRQSGERVTEVVVAPHQRRSKRRFGAKRHWIVDVLDAGPIESAEVLSRDAEVELWSEPLGFPEEQRQPKTLESRPAAFVAQC